MVRSFRRLISILSNLKEYCWCCQWNRNEWIGLRIFIERKGKCFYCRIDDLDMKYGPSLTAELTKQESKDNKYSQPYPTYRELNKLLKLANRKLNGCKK